MNNLYIAIDFEDKWFGLTCKDKFRKGQAPGLPLRMTEEAKKAYASNPQYLLEVKAKESTHTQVFINISQRDGRLIRGIKYPFLEVIHPIVCYVFKLDPGQDKIEIFDKNKIYKSSGSIKSAKDICVATFRVANGKYMIIPSTKNEESYGEFQMKVYLECAKDEASLTKPAEKSIKFNYVAEEEEEVTQYSRQEKALYSLRTKYIIY